MEEEQTHASAADLARAEMSLVLSTAMLAKKDGRPANDPAHTVNLDLGSKEPLEHVVGQLRTDPNVDDYVDVELRQHGRTLHDVASVDPNVELRVDAASGIDEKPVGDTVEALEHPARERVRVPETVLRGEERHEEPVGLRRGQALGVEQRRMLVRMLDEQQNDKTLSYRRIQTLTGVHRNTVYKIKKQRDAQNCARVPVDGGADGAPRWRTVGVPVPGRQGGFRTCKLNDDHKRFCTRVVVENPRLTVAQVRQELENHFPTLSVSDATVWRTLHNSNLSFLRAKMRDPRQEGTAAHKAEREAFLLEQKKGNAGLLGASNLFFMDETVVYLNEVPSRAWGSAKHPGEIRKSKGKTRTIGLYAGLGLVDESFQRDRWVDEVQAARLVLPKRLTDGRSNAFTVKPDGTWDYAPEPPTFALYWWIRPSTRTLTALPKFLTIDDVLDHNFKLRHVNLQESEDSIQSIIDKNGQVNANFLKEFVTSVDSADSISDHKLLELLWYNNIEHREVDAEGNLVRHSYTKAKRNQVAYKYVSRDAAIQYLRKLRQLVARAVRSVSTDDKVLNVVKDVREDLDDTVVPRAYFARPTLGGPLNSERGDQNLFLSYIRGASEYFESAFPQGIRRAVRMAWDSAPTHGKVDVTKNVKSFVHDWVTRALKIAGAIFLPVRDPDTNPAERLFAFVKHVVRRDMTNAMGEVSEREMVQLIDQAFMEVTPKMVEGWVRHASYVVDGDPVATTTLDPTQMLDALIREWSQRHKHPLDTSMRRKLVARDSQATRELMARFDTVADAFAFEGDEGDEGDEERFSAHAVEYGSPEAARDWSTIELDEAKLSDNNTDALLDWARWTLREATGARGSDDIVINGKRFEKRVRRGMTIVSKTPGLHSMKDVGRVDKFGELENVTLVFAHPLKDGLCCVDDDGEYKFFGNPEASPPDTSVRLELDAHVVVHSDSAGRRKVFPNNLRAPYYAGLHDMLRKADDDTHFSLMALWISTFVLAKGSQLSSTLDVLCAELDGRSGLLFHLHRARRHALSACAIIKVDEPLAPDGPTPYSRELDRRCVDALLDMHEHMFSTSSYATFKVVKQVVYGGKQLLTLDRASTSRVQPADNRIVPSVIVVEVSELAETELDEVTVIARNSMRVELYYADKKSSVPYFGHRRVGEYAVKGDDDGKFARLADKALSELEHTSYKDSVPGETERSRKFSICAIALQAFEHEHERARERRKHFVERALGVVGAEALANPSDPALHDQLRAIIDEELREWHRMAAPGETGSKHGQRVVGDPMASTLAYDKLPPRLNVYDMRKKRRADVRMLNTARGSPNERRWPGYPANEQDKRDGKDIEVRGGDKVLAKMSSKPIRYIRIDKLLQPEDGFMGSVTFEDDSTVAMNTPHDFKKIFTDQSDQNNGKYALARQRYQENEKKKQKHGLVSASNGIPTILGVCAGYAIRYHSGELQLTNNDVIVYDADHNVFRPPKNVSYDELLKKKLVHIQLKNKNNDSVTKYLKANDRLRVSIADVRSAIHTPKLTDCFPDYLFRKHDDERLRVTNKKDNTECLVSKTKLRNLCREHSVDDLLRTGSHLGNICKEE